MSHAAGASTGRLRIALVATAAVAVLEAAGGLRSGSLALLSDSAHVAMDAVALAIALAAAVQAKRPATARQTYGFARYEILAALANGGLLTAVTVLIVVEAARRFAQPELPEGAIMIGVAAIGLVVNVAVGLMLAREHHHDLNLRAAVLHVAGDALGALAVIIGGGIIALTGAAWVDPLLSLLVAGIIVAGVFGIVREATGVLLESAPGHADVESVRERIRTVEGVVEVHDLHVWTIGSGSHALSAHVLLDDRKLSEAGGILRSIDAAMREDFDITHVTVQFECESCEPDTTIICSQAGVRPPRESVS
ncbi:MAG TPA: cation diffusion facilitator family transporter [Candidatus Limnocylindria bacterium]|nr:cation diffusion facilitator family transporter [Candidatus Limnocylindria bacterium]